MSLDRHLVATLITLSVSTSYAYADDGVEADEKQDGDQKKEKKKKKKDKKVDPHIPEIGGYLQVDYEHAFDTDAADDDDTDEFQVRRLRVKVKGKVIKKVGYNVELDPVADSFLELLRDAYIELKHLPDQEIRIGQQKAQFGYENLESSGKLYVINRAEVSDELARGNSLRDIGIGLMGDIKLGRGYSIEDAITVLNGAGQNTGDDTRRKNVFGRLGVRFQCEEHDLDVRAGVSGGYGDLFDQGDLDNDFDDHRYVIKRVGADLQVDYKYAFVAVEAVTGQDRDIATDEKFNANGWYVLAAGKTPWHAGPVIRYDTLEEEQRWTFGGYWGEVDSDLRVMAQLEHRKDQDDRVIVWTQARF